MFEIEAASLASGSALSTDPILETPCRKRVPDLFLDVLCLFESEFWDIEIMLGP